MLEPIEDPTLLRAKLITETAKIPWRELQRFFAMGRTMQVAAGVDLVELGVWMTCDQSDEVRAVLNRAGIAPVSDDQARDWLAVDASVWALVVRPWVLVQAPSDRPERRG